MRVHSRTHPGRLRTFGNFQIHRDVTLLTCATGGSEKATVTVEYGVHKDLNNSVHAPRLLDLDRPLYLLDHLHLSLCPKVHAYP